MPVASPRRPRVGIAGVTGYTGVELFRLLSTHPGVEVAALAAGRGAGQPLDASWPALAGVGAPPVEALTVGWTTGLDAVLLALPHGISAGFVASLVEAGRLAQGLKVVDLGADFRLTDPAVYASAYGAEHPAPELLRTAVYGLTELHRDGVAEASLVANPGCYPTATALGARALMAAGCTGPVHSACMSGVSGAGRKAGPRTMYCEVQESVGAYGVCGAHRHVPEMEQELGVSVVFTPHLVPMIRGMLATVTMTAPASLTAEALAQAVQRLYESETLIVVRDGPPATRDVRGSGCAHIFVTCDPARGVAQAFVAIDNVGKGAATQAVQNLNLMLGLPETTGIPTLPLLP